MIPLDQGNRGSGKKLKGLPGAAAVVILSAASFVSIAAPQTSNAPRLLPDPVKTEAAATENAPAPSDIREFGPWSHHPVTDATAGETADVAPPLPTFIVRTGDSLFSTIENWSRQSGWQVSWEVKSDYIVGAEARFTGKFEDALNALIASLGGDVASLKVEMYAGNKVVRITELNKPNKE